MPDEQADSMREQRGDPFEGGAVAGAGRHRDDRGGRQAADHAGQRALHAGDHDDRFGQASVSTSARRRCSPATPQSHEQRRCEAERLEDRLTFRRHRQIGSAGRHHDHPSAPARRRDGRRGWRGRPLAATAPGPNPPAAPAADAALTCSSVARVSRTGPSVPAKQLRDHRRALLGRLARPVDGLGQAEPQVAVVVHPGEAQVGIGQAPQLAHRVVGRATARGDLFDERAQ